MAAALERLHATVIATAGRGVLIRGPSGSGKSDLALRCLFLPTGPALPAPFCLLADDQVEISRDGADLLARPPATIAGLLEVRGLGIVRLPHTSSARLELIIDLTPQTAIERLPPPATVTLLGVTLPLLALDPTPPSAPARLALALTAERL